MKRTAFLLIILALVVVACSAPAKPTAEATHAAMPDLGGRKLRIATDPIPPFVVVANDGSLTGFEPDLVLEICKFLNCTATWTNVSYDGIFAALAAGEYDLVVTDVAYTAERDQIVDFTDPYYLSGIVAVVRSDETKIQTPKDLLLPGIITGVQTGGEGGLAATKLGIPNDQVKDYPTVDVKYLSLLNSDVRAVLDTVEIADGFVTTYQGKMKILRDKDGPIIVTPQLISAVVQQGDDGLREAFNAAIKQLKQDGTVKRLLEKWKIIVSIPQ